MWGRRELGKQNNWKRNRNTTQEGQPNPSLPMCPMDVGEFQQPLAQGPEDRVFIHPGSDTFSRTPRPSQLQAGP